MWLNYIEKPEKIKAIYGDKIPTLNNVCVQSIKFITGADLVCELVIDLKDMPDQIPLKWKGFNTIQICFSLIESESRLFNLSGQDVFGSVSFESESTGLVLVSVLFQSGQQINVACKWVVINSISAYTNSLDE